MRKILLAVLFLTSCQDNEADIPELTTSPAQQIGSTSVVMESELTEIGPVRPVNFGFLWDNQPDISIATASNRLVLGSTSEKRKFSINLGGLEPSTTYYYRGFAANLEYTKIYYGNVVSFTTLP